MLGLGQLNALFSGAKIGSTFLPANDLIRQYGIGDGPLFRVKMSAYKNTEIKISANDGKVKVEAPPSTSPIAEFEVLHNAETLTMSHEHEWGESQGIAGIISKSFNKGFFGLSGDTIMQVLKGAQDLKERNSAQLQTEFNTWGGLDVAEVYRGNSRPEFTVRFVLLATTNPLIEVIVPAIIFTYLSYPSLSSEKSMSKLMSTVNSGIESGIGSLIGATTTTGQTEEAQKQAGEALKQAYDAIKGASAGTWRYRVGDAPPFWVVSSSNGLIYLPNAHIKNVTVEYYGPWIEAPDSSSFLNSIANSSSKSNIGLNPAEIFPDSTIIGESFLTSGKNGSLGGYPTYANVSITFKHSFGKIFGEEWLMSMNGASQQFGSTSS